jgi:Tol biopolymer transport system component
MAYANFCGSCQRINRWSNPDQTLDGVVVGEATGIQPTDERRALNNTRTTVASFRPEGGQIVDRAPERPEIDLAYVVGPVGDSDVHVLDLATGEVDVMADETCDEAEPTWFPDGESVVYQSNCSGSYDLYRVSRTGGIVQQLTLTPDMDEREPDVAPSGEQIAYRVSPKDANRNGDGLLWLMNVANGSRFSLSIRGRSPVWSPSGDALVFMSEQSSGWEIYVYTLATGEIRRITACESNCRWPAWSPDGQYILFHTTTAANSTTADTIWFVARTGGEPTLFVSGDHTGRGTWSATGWMAFNSDHGIEIMHVASGGGRDVLLEGDSHWAPVWSR